MLQLVLVLGPRVDTYVHVSCSKCTHAAWQPRGLWIGVSGLNISMLGEGHTLMFAAVAVVVSELRALGLEEAARVVHRKRAVPSVLQVVVGLDHSLTQQLLNVKDKVVSEGE